MAEEKQWPFVFQCGRIQGTAKKTKNPEWTLHQGKGSRLWTKRINFDQSFQQTPAVVTGLSLLDIVTDDDIRANVEADNISADGFDIKITTWNDTKLWSITATWFAYEKIPATVQGTMLHSGRLAFNRKLKGYDLDEGSQERSIVQSVKYPVKFNTTPNVVIGFCLVDHLNDADCRMKIKAENVTNQGFDVKLTTWSDSHVWSSSVCWIAVDGALTRSAGGRIQTGQHLFKQAHPGYQLHKGEGARLLSEHVLFAKPFTSHVKKDNIITFLSGMDICVEEERDLRVCVEPQNPTAQGFELKLSTWNDSRVNSASADWLAFGDGEAVPVAVNNNNAANNNNNEVAVHAAKKQKNSDEKATVTKEDEECKICYESNINTVIVPCGHMCVCEACSKMLLASQKSACPICNQKIQQIIKTYST
jgi:hypothetical protein